jgi:prepilin-type processing-associated H-X9-DG protein
MNRKTKLTRKELIVALGCIIFLLLNIGAIGSGGRRRAKEMVCLSNLRQWGTMFEMFTNDHDGYFNSGWDVGETELWMNALRPYYMDNLNLLLCPEAGRAIESVTDSIVFRAWFRDFNLPEEGQFHCVSSYGINSWTNNMTKDRGFRSEYSFWKNARSYEGRNNIPVFADSTWHDAWPLATDYPAPYPDSYWVGDAGVSGEMNHFCIDRHNGAINMLFMDWSARKVGLKELWSLKWHRGYNTWGPWTRAGGVRPEDWPSWMRNFKEY